MARQNFLECFCKVLASAKGPRVRDRACLINSFMCDLHTSYQRLHTTSLDPFSVIEAVTNIYEPLEHAHLFLSRAVETIKF